MFSDVLQRSFLQNSVLDYVIFLAAFLIGILIIKIIKSIVLHRLKAWSKKTATTIDDFLIRIIEEKLIPLLYYGVFYLSFKNLTLTPDVTNVIDIEWVVSGLQISDFH
jgi:hypothetical protein